MTARRAGGDGSTAWPPTTDCASASCGARSPSRRAHRAARARSDEPSAPPRLRAADRRRAGRLARPGDVGRVARAVRARWPARVLRRPTRVLQTLAELRPMAAIGPVALEEARDVLHDRLVTLDWDPPARRYGRLFVGTPHQARGRSFRVVFVPGLAERVVPQRPREDPLLLDDRRRARRWRARRSGRAQRRRAAAAEDCDRRGDASGSICPIRGWTSPKRARACRRSTRSTSCARSPGACPTIACWPRDAADEAGASLAWPAPAGSRSRDRRSRARSGVLKPLLDSRDPAVGEGPRALSARPQRGAAALGDQPLGARPDRLVDERRLIRVAPGDRSGASTSIGSARARIRCRRCSGFSPCPYQFLLATIHRLEPWDEPEPLVRMDPLTRGSLFHKAQAEFFRAMQARGRAAGHARARCPSARRRRSTRCSIASRPSTRRSWRRRSSASGATRSASCAATSASGCRSWPTRRRGCRSTSSSASA